MGQFGVIFPSHGEPHTTEIIFEFGRLECPFELIGAICLIAGDLIWCIFEDIIPRFDGCVFEGMAGFRACIEHHISISWHKTMYRHKTAATINEVAETNWSSCSRIGRNEIRTAAMNPIAKTKIKAATLFGSLSFETMMMKYSAARVNIFDGDAWSVLSSS